MVNMNSSTGYVMRERERKKWIKVIYLQCEIYVQILI